MVCSPLRPLSLATVWYARFYQAGPAPVVGNHQVPRVPLPDVGVTFIRKPCTGSSEGITPRSSLPTDSFANPMWLSLPSASGLVQGVLAGCYQPLLPMGSSRRYLCESFLGCLVPYPGGSHRVPIPVSSSVSSAFPIKRLGRLPALFCEHDFSQRDCRGCRHSIMFRPPSLLASQIVPTAMPIAQGSRGFYVRAERASLPPHAPNMLAA